MKKLLLFTLILCLLLPGCSKVSEDIQIVATTQPVYDLTLRLCEDTGLAVTRLITENVSCLHDYSLQVDQMRAVENAELIVMSGAGMEEFLEDILTGKAAVIDASENVDLICAGHDHHGESSHDGHHHEQDPHIWLSPVNGQIMADNICAGLIRQYPHLEEAFRNNLVSLTADLTVLQAYAEEELSDIRCREIITFHDGFSYMAQSFGITVLEAVEEESGSEASAAELIHLIQLVDEHQLPCVFTEANGSTAAAQIIAAETGVPAFSLDMGMGERNYFETMYHNIDTLKEALG